MQNVFLFFKKIEVVSRRQVELQLRLDQFGRVALSTPVARRDSVDRRSGRVLTNCKLIRTTSDKLQNLLDDFE